MSFPDGPTGFWRFREEHEQAAPARFVAPGDTVGREFGLLESAAVPGRPGAPREPCLRGLAELMGRETPPIEQEIDDLALRRDQVDLRDRDGDPVPVT